jgi:hypothetical protein
MFTIRKKKKLMFTSCHFIASGKAQKEEAINNNLP